jgi:hypothetical protein
MIQPCFPTAHRLTFLSSPPVTNTRPDLWPSAKQFTLEPWATKSSEKATAKLLIVTKIWNLLLRVRQTSIRRNSFRKVTTHNINTTLWENSRQLFYLRSLHERLVDDAITRYSNLYLQTSQSNTAAGDLVLVVHCLNIFIFEYKIQHTLVNFELPTQNVFYQKLLHVYTPVIWEAHISKSTTCSASLLSFFFTTSSICFQYPWHTLPSVEIGDREQGSGLPYVVHVNPWKFVTTQLDCSAGGLLERCSCG